MSKAKSMSTTLAIQSELLKRNAASPIRKLAAELGRLFQLMDECERIAISARTSDSPEIGRLEFDAKAVEDFAWRRHHFIEDAILDREPTDALDSLIVLILATSAMDGGEQWVRTTIEAKSADEREDLIRKFDDEHLKLSRMFRTAARGLMRDLGVTPEKLGLDAYWGGGQTCCDFETCVRSLRSKAKQAGISTEATA